MRKFFVLTIVFVVASLLAACSTNEQASLTAEEVKAIVVESVPQSLTEEQVKAIVIESVPQSLTEEQIKAIVVESVPQSLTEEQVKAIVIESVPQSLTEEQVSSIVLGVLDAQKIEEEEVLSQYLIPISWFSKNGLTFENGLTVAAYCEQGARAWQGEITFDIVPDDASIELVEVNCIQYKPGETIPQAELEQMKGTGTIWFLFPIQGTETQFGDCPCPNGDC